LIQILSVKAFGPAVIVLACAQARFINRDIAREIRPQWRLPRRFDGKAGKLRGLPLYRALTLAATRPRAAWQDASLPTLARSRFQADTEANRPTNPGIPLIRK
jgi:hypothetical protein